ncbi:unnamed protein product [Peronospora destructor]|uniref:Uncharacterized protein n=1 Tax=Peronospora destructor TaxID=86335 RepID=A0AAV0UMN3_9STRA|nr:unnamed protein product [Peronospora destructor]
MVRKTTSWRTPAGSQDVHHEHHTTQKDVIVPLVLWNEPPRVKVSSLHVLQLPISQPSQNSSFLVNEKDGTPKNEMDKKLDTCTQMCVFAGTVDGVIVFWRFEQDIVAQVNMLVFPGAERGGNPIVGIVSGIDEWGQSTLISATKDGALASWQLPNGACAQANASLAKELAPLLGLEMLCNRRFTIVTSEVSRLMVLDTWRMQLLYCMDTAQEQIRRSIAVGGLPMSRSKSQRPILVRSSSGSNRESRYGGASVDQTTDSPSARGRMSPSRLSLAGHVPDAKRRTRFFPSRAAAEEQGQRWDAVVLSLGAEGLVKCFLWQQPRGQPLNGTSSTATEGGGSASVAWGFRWVQRSSWVISWADQAEDITCSQSTSLKDGDNMNPQTALMGSIDNSYFPLSVKVSPDSFLVLLIWRTKFVILKRKWLCPLELRTDGQANREFFRQFRSTTTIGSCRITPAEFVRQATSTYKNGHPNSCNASGNYGNIYWENGEFLEDSNIVLWTNTGHIFQFMPAELSADPGGKLFIFTKDQDQLVPRSDSKELSVIDKAVYITSMDRCKCCDLVVQKDECLHTKLRKSVTLLTGQRQDPGYTSCIQTGSSFSESTLQVVHMCHRGIMGHWTMPAVRVSSPMRIFRNKSNIIAPRAPLAERVRFHSLTDGFEAAEVAALETQSSSTFKEVRRAGTRHKRREGLNDALKDTTGSRVPITNTTAAAIASSLLATALTGRRGPSDVKDEPDQPEAGGSEQKESEHLGYRYLLDIPIIAKGFADGMLYIGLLSQEHLSSRAEESPINTATRLSCHSGRVTALAHYCWGARATLTASSRVSSPTSASETHFATEKNPFYRSRFRDPSSKRITKSWHTGKNSGDRTRGRSLTIKKWDGSGSNNGSSPDSPNNQPSITFMLFSGGTDGVLLVIELILYHSANGFVRKEANILQKFRNHRGAIQQISISPLKKGDGEDWDAMYPDRLVATVGVDRKVVLYAPQYTQHALLQQSRVYNSPTGYADGRYIAKWNCVLELSEHANSICSLAWHLERGLLYVECSDRMVYVWSTDTGILERKVPYALVYGDDFASDESFTDGANGVGGSVVQNRTLLIGNAAAQFLEFGALRSAEQLKKNWTSYYASLSQSNGTALNICETGLQAAQASMYATGSMELFMLSLLLSWGVTPAIDQSCRTILGIEPPHVLYSCALQDFTSGALTIPVPWSTPKVSALAAADPSVAFESELNNKVMPVVPAFARNWQHSSALSASIALGVLSLCMSCMEFQHPKSGNGVMSATNKEEFQVLWSQLITQHSVVLRESVAQFREPALEELAAFGFDSCEYTQLAALAAQTRALSQVATVFTGGSSNGVSGGSDLGTKAFSLVVERLGSLVLLTSTIGTYFPGEISPDGAREVCDILVFLLKAPERFVASVSAELLAKGLMLFRPHLVDLSSLIVQLLLIDMREKQRRAKSKDSEEVLSGPGGSLANFREGGSGGSNAAMSLLVEVGAYESAFVLGLLQQEMRHHRPPGFHTSVLLYMMELVNTHYLLMCRHLPVFVDTIMACLDPTKPDRRRRCLPLSTRCLHSLVRRFPMVDFHKDTQRLALGTMEAVIVIYDLCTATKWRVLNGHTSAVSAVRFRSDGQVLVSYAARGSSVRWWNSGNAGLFGGMLRMHQSSCLKEHKLTALKESPNCGASASIGGASPGLKQIIQTCRFHFLTRQNSSGDGQSSNSEPLQCILRLTREDASQVQFLL